MTSVHYFPRYSQSENFVTNNSLLLLSRLYEFNRFKFGKLLSILCSNNDVDTPDIGMQFQQQIGTSASVVDGYISQRNFYLAVETKLGETFNVGQLKRHLNIFQEWLEFECEHEICLCSDMEKTSFKKQSSGGIMGHRYFDLRTTLCGPLPDGIVEIAAKLQKIKWE